MSFVGRFIHDFIQAHMASPEAREQVLELRIRETEKYAEKMYAGFGTLPSRSPCALQYTTPTLRSKTIYREPLVPWGYWKTRTALAKVCMVLPTQDACSCLHPPYTQLYDRDANPHVQRMPGHSKGVDPWW